MKPHLLFLILLGTSIISPTLASGKPNFGEVGIAGNGCPEEADAESVKAFNAEKESKLKTESSFIKLLKTVFLEILKAKDVQNADL